MHRFVFFAFPYRWDNDLNKAPHYTLYSILSLKIYFIIFLSIMLCHIINIYILKKRLAPTFSKINYLSQIIHCIENTNIPSSVEEWDTGSGNAIEHYERMKNNKIEILSVMGSNFIYNLVLIAPIFVLGEEE